MNALIIGYGSIGRRHADILSDLNVIEKIVVVSKQEDVLYRSYKSIDEIFDLTEFDYFVIASPTNLHFDHLKKINAKVSGKIILVEKPLFQNVENIKLNNDVFVAYNLRFHPILIKLSQLLKKEKSLSVNVITGQYLPDWRPERDYRESYSASRERGGGVLLDLSHEIDYLLNLFGTIKHISAINKRISDLEINSDDYITAIGQFDNGVHFNFTMDYLSKKAIRQILIQTKDSTVKVDLIENSIEVIKIGNMVEVFDNFNIDKNISYQEMHKSALGIIERDRICKYNEAMNVLLIIDRIRKRNLYEL